MLRAIRRRANPSLILGLLSLAGLAVSLYLSRIHFFLYGHPEYRQFGCDVNGTFDCSYVISSPWSEVLPGVPIAAVAAGTFMAIFVLHVALRRRAPAASSSTGFILTAGALLASLVYLAIMIFALGRACLLCLLLDAIILATAVLYLVNLKRWQVFGKASVGGWIGAGVVAILCIGTTVEGLRLLLERSMHQEVAETIERIKHTPETPLPFGHAVPGKVTLYIFSDLKCWSCREGFSTTMKLHQIYGNKLHIVYKSFPMDTVCNRTLTRTVHPGSCRAARVAISVAYHVPYMDVLTKLFADQDHMDDIVRSLEADPQVSDNLPNADGILARDIADGAAVGLTVVPTYFLNGRRIERPQPLPVWTAVINDLLSRQPPDAAATP